jgi:uncharacterized protein (DUF58 family)
VSAVAPTNRLIWLVAVVCGAVALAAAAIPALTIPAVLLVALVVVGVAIDGYRGGRGLEGLRVTAPPLIRTVRDRHTALPFSVVNEADPAGAVRASFVYPDSFQKDAEAIEAGNMGRLQKVDLDAGFESRVRGEFRIAKVWLSGRSPMGLFASRRDVAVDVTVRVYPNLLEDPTGAGLLRSGLTGARIVRQSGKGREFETLRDYAVGDAMDEVDWKATARRGVPVVRVFQRERTQEIYVAVDASRLSARPVEGQTTLEHYVNAALVMQLTAESQGDRFGLITFSDKVHNFVRASAGKRHYTLCRDAIYQLQPEIVEPDFAALFSLIAQRLTKRALVVVLTALDDPMIGEMFERNVVIASRRHLVLAAMVRPAGAHPLFDREATEVDEIYGHLAGHLRWRKLQELSSACRHKGVRLHLLNPGKISGQLSSIYLDVKRRQLV